MLHEIHVAAAIGNIVLLFALIYVFIHSYRETRSWFALGLVTFTLVLGFSAVISWPIFISFFIGTQKCPIEFFYTAASVFEFFALSLLLILVWR